MRGGFEHFIPKRSIGIDGGHSDLANRRSVLRSDPGYAKWFAVSSTGEGNDSARAEQSVNAFEERSAAAYIDGHHSLVEGTTPDVGRGEQNGQGEIDARVAALAEALGAQIVQELFWRQGCAFANQFQERVGRFGIIGCVGRGGREFFLSFFCIFLASYENLGDCAAVHQLADEFLDSRRLIARGGNGELDTHAGLRMRDAYHTIEEKLRIEDAGAH